MMWLGYCKLCMEICKRFLKLYSDCSNQNNTHITTDGYNWKENWGCEFFLLLWQKCCFEFSVIKSCPTLCDPMDYRPPGSSVHVILQARIVEWVAISFSRGSSWLRGWTHVSCIAREFFTTEPLWSPDRSVMQQKILAFVILISLDSYLYIQHERIISCVLWRKWYV